MRRGYAASIVVPEHNGPKAWKAEGMTVIPCPEQTGRSQDCTTCKLCFNDKALLKRRAVIAFAAHGQSAKKVKQQLVRIANAENTVNAR
jgi:hypothetical protein